MKKTFFAGFTWLLLTCTIYSQNSRSTAKLAPGFSFAGFISSSEELSIARDSITVLLNEISTKAVRDFARDFKNVPDAKWFKKENGFAVFFAGDSIQTWIFYDKSGNRECVIRDYSENRLPGEIRHIVKSTYYDFSIYLVNEVTINDITGYIIKIRDKNSLKEIKVVDGEMEVMREYNSR
jgi:hypothetical protein